MKWSNHWCNYPLTRAQCLLSNSYMLSIVSDHWSTALYHRHVPLPLPLSLIFYSPLHFIMSSLADAPIQSVLIFNHLSFSSPFYGSFTGSLGSSGSPGDPGGARPIAQLLAQAKSHSRAAYSPLALASYGLIVSDWTDTHWQGWHYHLKHCGMVVWCLGWLVKPITCQISPLSALFAPAGPPPPPPPPPPPVLLTVHNPCITADGDSIQSVTQLPSLFQNDLPLWKGVKK